MLSQNTLKKGLQTVGAKSQTKGNPRNSHDSRKMESLSSIGKISFIDLQAQKLRLGSRIEEAIQRVLDHGHYIMGPEVYALEERLSKFTGARHVITCSNGTDALTLMLMAKNVQAKDAILVPSFTFAATAEVVAHLGATPIFVDVLEDTFNIDPRSIELGVETAKKLGLKARGVISVDLFGQPAEYDALEKMCKELDLWLFSDAAQSFGGSYKGQRVGTLGLATATSFYPSKPLGCYGDGGAIFTDDDELAEIIKSLRVHGEGSHKYDNVRVGMNGRLDTLQAAILIEKLNIFEEELQSRQKVADRYTQRFEAMLQTQKLLPEVESAWAQYTVVLEQGTREALVQALNEKQIPTAIHYPKPLHSQPAYCHFPRASKEGCKEGNKESNKNRLPMSENLAARVLSLPIHPYLETDVQDFIIQNVIDFCAQKQDS